MPAVGKESLGVQQPSDMRETLGRCESHTWQHSISLQLLLFFLIVIFYLFIYLYIFKIFGCVGSSPVCEGFP